MPVAHRTTSRRANHIPRNPPSTRFHLTLAVDTKVLHNRTPAAIRNRDINPSKTMEGPLLVITEIQNGSNLGFNSHSHKVGVMFWHRM